MALWFALGLPALPLQMMARALPYEAPLAITEGPPERAWIAFCNASARAAGITPAMKLAAAQALAHSLVAMPRHPDREREALQELATWAYQFSAHVTIRTGSCSSGVVLESGASERLFNGREALHRRIRHGLAELGYRACFGQAPTPQAAWLIGTARAMGLAAVDAPADGVPPASIPPLLCKALAALPVNVLEWDAETTRTLESLGLCTIGHLLDAPRDAFGRRFGPERLEQLDRLTGLRPDPQPSFAPPQKFFARLELPADVTQADQLMFPARRLLSCLEGFLHARHAGAVELIFTARPSARSTRAPAPTGIVLALASPQRSAERLARLLTERLARVNLVEPAIELSLTVERMAPLQDLNASLLPPSREHVRDGLDWLQLAETLHARLGSERVFQLQIVNDHRPEYAMRIVPLAATPDRASAAPEPEPEPGQRPLLILAAPQALRCPGAARSDPPHDPPPQYGGPLALLAGPERIEAGWWDCGDPDRAAVHRDYFVARNPRGQTLWIYRELQQPRRWFLQGFFC